MPQRYGGFTHFIKVSFSTIFNVSTNGHAVKRCFMSLPCEWALVAALGRTSVLHLLPDPRQSAHQAVYICVCVFRSVQDSLQILGNISLILIFFSSQPTPTSRFIQGYLGAVTSAVSIAVCSFSILYILILTLIIHCYSVKNIIQ